MPVFFSFNRYLQIGGKNKMVNVRKRGNVYEYNFDVAKIEGKRKRISRKAVRTLITNYNEMNSNKNSVVVQQVVAKKN